jgi:nucleoside-diphosphate kinase
MTSIAGEVWQFSVEWFDPSPQMKKPYLLKYFVESNHVEMVDLKTKKLFLKKTDCPPEITVTDFFLGNKIIILSRELEIVDYGDAFTKQKLQHQTQRSLICFTSDSYHNWGKMLDCVISNKLNLIKLRLLNLTEIQADNVLRTLSLNTRRTGILTRGLCLFVYVHGEDGITSLTKIGEHLQNEFGTNQSEPTVLYPSNGIEYNQITELIANSPSTPTFDNCTCCVIKPHAFKDGHVGKILDIIISQGYEISALDTLYFNKTQAEEFLEVYKGVIPTFTEQCINLASGPCIALEIRAEDAVTVFRQTTGPWDVNIAKEIRPQSIRAKFGIDNIYCAVHCTDLPTDGEYESEYCFRIMSPLI